VPLTGKDFTLQLNNIFRYNAEGRLAEEGVQYDQRSMLRQLDADAGQVQLEPIAPQPAPEELLLSRPRTSSMTQSRPQPNGVHDRSGNNKARQRKRFPYADR